MQLSMDFRVSFSKETYEYGRRSSGETHGVVLTKPHIVELILDLAGYTQDRDLPSMRLLEPACGHGAFLLPAIQRLMKVAKTGRVKPSRLGDCIRAFDIDEEHVAITRAAVVETLRALGVNDADATQLAQTWVHCDDFLLAKCEPKFDAVVGNPPYIRIEQIAPELQAEYRSRYQSIYDRADLYVAFIERGLALLGPRGLLSFVCADRWTLNRYGAPLRRLIADDFHVRSYVDLHQASPFESEVSAYPSIFAIGRQDVGPVMVARMAAGTEVECEALQTAIHSGKGKGASAVTFYPTWFEGDAPWIVTSPEQNEMLRSLEATFAPIEDGNMAHVGIGVATGRDEVFILDRAAAKGAGIEKDRLVPLVMRDDIERGHIRDGGRFVINVFRDDGGLVDLAQYPKLARYLKGNATAIRKRHVAQKAPANWYRTIDRVYPKLVGTPKLLVPDIAGSNEVAFDVGHYHPHHNLYFVTSDQWDLEVLGGLLSSRVALFFVWSYAVKMRGGYLRFQAQYLRRIRLPAPGSLAAPLRAKIKKAFRLRNFSALDELALAAYGIPKLPDFEFVDTRGR
jgi:adenine-specific DNA-methyltransferase